MKMLRLPAIKVQLGVPLPWNVRDEGTRLLLARGQVIQSEAQLAALLARGVYVDVEEARAVEHQHGSTGAKERDDLIGTAAVKARATVSRPQNLFDLWSKSADEMRKLMDRVLHAPDLAARIDQFSQWLVELVDKDADVALYHCVRQEAAHLYFYGYSHSIHTAILCLLMTRRLNWPVSRTMSLVKAAITMNMSILELQGKMASQEEPMRESQRTVIRRHPQEAVEWLTRAGVTDTEWLTAIAQHHERPDGSGYPNSVTEISESAVVLHVADVFIAKISPRILRPALSILEAAKQLFREDQGGPISSAAIKEFGIYPPGDVVKLASGEIGVVMRRTDNAKCPVVATLTDTTGHPTVHTEQRDTTRPDYAIAAHVTDRSLVARMPPERVYGYAKASPTNTTG